MTAGEAPRIVVLLVWALTTVLWIAPGLTVPDGAGYYVYLPSTWFDRDLVFFDEWQQLGMVRDGRILHKEVTRTDHLGNHWTVGSAMYWFPNFLAGDLMRWAVPTLRQFPRNGFSLPYNVPVIFASAVAGLLTLLIGFRLARLVSPASAAALAAVGVWFGTPLMWYSLRNGVMSHAVSALACALAFSCAMRLRQRQDLSSWVLSGFAAGFAFAVRPQNAPVILLPFLFAEWRQERRVARLAVYAAAILAAALPQWIVSTHIYGSPLTYLWGGEATPFAAFDRMWTWEPLFSWYHGLFPWSPFALIGMAGILMLFRRDRRLAWAGLFLFVTQWLINATLERSFWGAYSFGQRRFDSCIVVFLLGAAVSLAAMPRWLAMASTALTSLWSLSLFIAAFDRIDLSRYYTPGELLDLQIAGLVELPAHLRLLDAVPRPLVATVILLLLVSAFLGGALLLVLRRLETRPLAIVCAVYLMFMAGWFALNGSRRNISEHRQLIASNRALAQIPGGADPRMALLANELEYLRKSGRTSLAQRTERELRELVAARQDAERRRGATR
jgi:hypothetical protein